MTQSSCTLINVNMNLHPTLLLDLTATMIHIIFNCLNNNWNCLFNPSLICRLGIRIKTIIFLSFTIFPFQSNGLIQTSYQLLFQAPSCQFPPLKFFFQLCNLPLINWSIVKYLIF
ncbi:hypothetical protein V6Z11_D03G047700 [Gossypium hirsutum]